MISVCIATYNGEKFIHEQIDSILPQLGFDDEVVISDDGSTDASVEMIKNIPDHRIHLFSNTKRHGFVGNFENGLMNCKGDYIFLCDQDDVWNINKVEIILSYLKTYDLVVHDAEIVNEKLKPLGKNYYSTLHHSEKFIANLYKTRFLGCCMAFNRKVLNSAMPIPQKVTGHDYWIGMYSLLHFKVCFAPNILIKYRRHGNNASTSSEKSGNTLFYKIITKRAFLMYYLLIRSITDFLKRICFGVL